MNRLRTNSHGEYMSIPGIVVGITERWKMQLKVDSIMAPEHNFGHRHSVFLMSHGDTMRSMIIFDGRL